MTAWNNDAITMVPWNNDEGMTSLEQQQGYDDDATMTWNGDMDDMDATMTIWNGGNNLMMIAW